MFVLKKILAHQVVLKKVTYFGKMAYLPPPLYFSSGAPQITGEWNYYKTRICGLFEPYSTSKCVNFRKRGVGSRKLKRGEPWPEFWKEGAGKRHLNVHFVFFSYIFCKIRQKRGGRGLSRKSAYTITSSVFQTF